MLSQLANTTGYMGLLAGVAMTGLAPSVHGPIVFSCGLILLLLSRSAS